MSMGMSYDYLGQDMVEIYDIFRIFCYLQLALMFPNIVIGVFGSIKNRFNDWSPHIDLLIFTTGQICNVICYTLTFLGSSEQLIASSSYSFYYFGESLSMSALLIFNNKMIG